MLEVHNETCEVNVRVREGWGREILHIGDK